MVDFNSLAGGALREKFNLAIAQIGRDILDPNKDPEAAGGIAITLKFLPKEGIIGVEFDVQTKLAKLNKDKAVLLIGQDAKTGRVEISEYRNNPARIQPTAAYAEDTRTVDAETGEIFDSTPIDLRRTSR